MLHLVAAPTIRPPSIRPDCPPWCSAHIDPTPSGGVAVHQVNLGTAGGIVVTVWQGPSDEAPRLELADENGTEIAQIPGADVRELAQLIGLAAVIVSAAAPGRHLRQGTALGQLYKIEKEA